MIFVYDLTEAQTYASLPKWFEECKRYIPFDTPPAFLIANKMDIVDESNYDDIYRPENPGRRLANNCGFEGFYALSAKSARQPQSDFEDILEEVGRAAMKARRRRQRKMLTSTERREQNQEVISLRQDPSPAVFGRRYNNNNENRRPSLRPLRNPHDSLDSESYEWVERPPNVAKDPCC